MVEEVHSFLNEGGVMPVEKIETMIDQFVMELAMAYVSRVRQLETHKDRRAAGSEAQACWVTDARRRLRRWGAVVVPETRTGVSGLSWGLTRYDLVFRLGNYKVFVEVKASDYRIAGELASRRHDAQSLGQLIGIGAGTAEPGRWALYYRIVAGPRPLLIRWTRRQAARAVGSADHEPPTVVHLSGRFLQGGWRKTLAGSRS
jgi:hypothetical protein